MDPRRYLTLLSGLFVAALALPLVAFVLGARPTLPDNREPTPRPELARLALLDVGSWQQSQAWFADRLPGRDLLIEANARVTLDLAGSSSNPEVTLGEDGWLFLTDTLDRTCLGGGHERELEAAARDLLALEAATGRTITVLVAPDKAAIEADRLRPADRDRSCAVADGERYARALAPLGPDLFAALSDARRHGPVYEVTDTHWTYPAAGRALDLLLERLGITHAAAVEERFGSFQQVDDLLRLLGRSVEREAPCLRSRRPGVVVAGARTRCRHPGTELELSTAATSDGPALIAPTVFIHDSFALRFRDRMPVWFDRLWTHHKGDPVAAPVADHIRAARHIVYQTAQRHAHDRLVNHEVAGQLAAVLRDELPRRELPVHGDGLHYEPQPGDRWIQLEVPGPPSKGWRARQRDAAGDWHIADRLYLGGDGVVWFDADALGPGEVRFADVEGNALVPARAWAVTLPDPAAAP